MHWEGSPAGRRAGKKPCRNRISSPQPLLSQSVDRLDYLPVDLCMTCRGLMLLRPRIGHQSAKLHQ
jgi:hypothetical protein